MHQHLSVLVYDREGNSFIAQIEDVDLNIHIIVVESCLFLSFAHIIRVVWLEHVSLSPILEFVIFNSAHHGDHLLSIL